MNGWSWRPLALPWALFAAMAASQNPPPRPPPPQPAVPMDAVDGIIEACRAHALVALGEGAHGNEQGHTFRLRLVRDQRFAQVVDDVVVEFGNAKYQALMDAFVRGDAVDEIALRRVWQDTTQPQPAWDARSTKRSSGPSATSTCCTRAAGSCAWSSATHLLTGTQCTRLRTSANVTAGVGTPQPSSGVR